MKLIAKFVLLFLLLLAQSLYAADLITIPDMSTGGRLTAAQFNQLLDALKEGTKDIKSGAILPGNYTEAGLPAAASYTGYIATCTDCSDSDGMALVQSNGSSWVAFGTFSEAGNYTPTGDWDWSGVGGGTTWPTFNQNTTGTAANLSGTPALPNGTTATTQSPADDSTKIATTEYVDTAVENAPHLQNIVEDTTPQLGGDLDLNSMGIDFPSVPNVTDALDEDDMNSDSATALATQQSIKAYVDTVFEGSITSVLDTTSGAVSVLKQAVTAFVDEDTTPDVSAKTVFRTANTASTTISDFDAGGGSLADGQILVVLVQDSNTTFDFTSSGLIGNSVDYTALNGETLFFVYSSTNTKWQYLGFPKVLSITSYTGMPYHYSDSITDPADDDDLTVDKVAFATTLTEVHCWAEGGGTIAITFQYCSAVASSCTSIETITCDSDGQSQTSTIDNPNVPDNNYIRILFAAPSGTVNSAGWELEGTQTW